MNRRNFLYAAAATALGTPLAFRAGAGSKVTTMEDIELLQAGWEALLPADHGLDFSLDPVTRAPEEWRSLLSPAAYDVLRKEGTERAGSHPYNIEKRDGVFLCAGCDLPLFTSAMKYDSGTGWPSFFTHIPGHMGTKKDFKLIWPRTEYHCIRCEGHQGHVFDDGPPPTGQRWCNNGVALRFVPRES